MQDMKQVKDLVRKMVNDTAESGAIGSVRFFVHRAMQSFGEIEGEGSDFYTACAFDTLTREVKHAVNKYDKPESDTPLMEGFKHLRSMTNQKATRH
jgi:hypothetical protein